ncbi:MAG: hypothetical protein KDA89_04880, partial [Planctomycetaceae bacterium]|nr:hypothetical protein [Planctomycetaceae bacterium]
AGDAVETDSVGRCDDMKPNHNSPMPREEYIEQAYFFRVYRERLEDRMPSQEILKTVHEEILSTTRLPMAIDFLRAEILHSGRISDAMKRLPHYFAPFQTFVIGRAEDELAKFDLVTALLILEREAHYRAEGATMPGVFVYQLECVARNRLGYVDGIPAIAGDPCFDERWKRWIMTLRQRLGAKELSELVYHASAHFAARRIGRSSVPPGSPTTVTDCSASNRSSAEKTAVEGVSDSTSASAGSADADQTAAESAPLFGDPEGRIARANIGRDPLYFFAALQRQLGYPEVPLSRKTLD